MHILRVLGIRIIPRILQQRAEFFLQKHHGALQRRAGVMHRGIGAGFRWELAQRIRQFGDAPDGVDKIQIILRHLTEFGVDFAGIVLGYPGFYDFGEGLDVIGDLR